MKSFILGFKRHPWRFAVSIFLSYSVLWTLIEPISFFYPDLHTGGHLYHLIFVAISIIAGIFFVYQPRRVSIKVNTSDTTLNIYYGDVFKTNSYTAIAVNEFFDSELGDPVSENSIHGMVIKNYFGGHTESFDAAVNNELQDIEPVNIDRPKGNTKKYPIGTAACITANQHKFLLFALSHTNIDTYKAYADLSNMVASLEGLFEKARNCTGGETLVLPLVGSGISGVGLPATQLLQLIILTIIDETKKRQICKNIDIVLHESRFEEIDLELIRRQWK